MRITDELVFTQIYSILHLISIQKWKKRLNSERKYRTCDYSLFGAYYSNIRILFIISKRSEYEYEYHYSVFYYSNIRITNYSLQHWCQSQHMQKDAWTQRICENPCNKSWSNNSSTSPTTNSGPCCWYTRSCQCSSFLEHWQLQNLRQRTLKRYLFWHFQDQDTMNLNP